MSSFIIHADGACKGNPGPGGWGAVVESPDGSERELSGGEAETTNNRMELMGLIQGLKAVPPGSAVIIRTDSQYAKDGITKWISGWKKNGWKTKAREPVKNQDLWILLDALNSGVKPQWEWVRGHSGHPGNERADALASAAANAARNAR